MNFIFDLGAVVFRWEPHEVLARALPHRAGTAAAVAELCDDFFLDYEGEWGDFDRGTISAEEMARAIAKRTGLGEHEVMRVVETVPNELVPMTESVALMDELKSAGHRLFYLSNMPAPFAAHLIENHALFDLFDDGVFSAHVHLVKPDPAIFELAAKQFGIVPAEAIFLDDRPANIDAARALGWRGVVFRNAAQARDEMRALGWM